MFARTLVKLVVFLLAVPVVAQAETPKAWTQRNLGDLVELYREFHMNPELSFCEKQTAQRLADRWKKLGAETTTDVGGHGVVALIKNGDGPTLMLRTDLDALPVTELTGLSYASKVKVKDKKGVETGVMHACGHDVHMTILTGVARYLVEHKKAWRGTVMLVGQPAEEVGAGAKAMLDDGLFKRFPKPDFAIGNHVDPSLATGRLGYREGYALANVDSVDVTVFGRGGHGAYPHTTVDPIVQAAELVMALQTIVSREVKPVEPAVITVGSIHGGTKHNIIGDSCHLQITVRSYSPEVRQQLIDAIRRKAEAVATGARAAKPTVEVSEGTPSLYNDPKLTQRLVSVFEGLVGAENVVGSEPSMGGEDFSRYGKAGVPICYYRLGAVDPKRLARYAKEGQQPPSLHSPHFYPDAEETLTVGITTMASVALELLKP